MLSVNGTSLVGASHHEAVMLLLQPGEEMTLSVQHDPLPAGFEVKLWAIVKMMIKKKFCNIV